MKAKQAIPIQSAKKIQTLTRMMNIAFEGKTGSEWGGVEEGLQKTCYEVRRTFKQTVKCQRVVK